MPTEHQGSLVWSACFSSPLPHSEIPPAPATANSPSALAKHFTSTFVASGQDETLCGTTSTIHFAPGAGIKGYWEMTGPGRRCCR
ncbi:hypothetical protein P8C59_009097 [Phyllachora maydis]|uniref:Uncharacterized protein n=1 Tax=Phyllachora maydis TaxID=1825666 RepID=A0AAD9MFV4_9PEZI|nr:hypothetical protein P8C59_009097 [Phyllachora maydis]